MLLPGSRRLSQNRLNGLAQNEGMERHMHSIVAMAETQAPTRLVDFSTQPCFPGMLKVGRMKHRV